MADVKIVSPDFKVFFRRLVVPSEFSKNPKLNQSPSQAAGIIDLADDQTKDAATAKADEKAEDQENFKSYAAELLKDYKPEAFRPLVISKANEVTARFYTDLKNKKVLLSDVNRQIESINKEVKEITAKKDVLGLMDKTTNKLLVEEEKFYHGQYDMLPIGSPEPDAVVWASEPHDQGTPPPVVVYRYYFARTLQNAIRLLDLPELIGIESEIIHGMRLISNNLKEANVILENPHNEMIQRRALGDLISEILTLRGLDGTNNARKSALSDLRGILGQQKMSLEREITVLKQSGKIKPFYEPVLLDCLIGPYQVQTVTTRQGQPGTASVSFHLPIDAQGAIPDLFMAFTSKDVFNLSMLEAQPLSRGTGTRGSTIPSTILPILRENLRETTLMPFDMVQIWGKRRFATGSTFPGDYAPMFTGFVTKTSVSYVGSTIGVTVGAEDVSKILRLSRVNIDPNIDPRFRVTGITPTVYVNKIVASQSTGGEIIKNMIKGSPGSFLGLSQVEVIEKVSQKPEGAKTIPKFTIGTRLVATAADFEGIRLNIWQDLLNQWPTYARQFKGAFRVWETDAKTKWDICREVAEITEFEFYADSMGVVNYHPPLYFLNPFAPQYFVENVEIINETHSTDETEILTVVEVASQAGFNMGAGLNSQRRIDSLIAAPEAMIQRYGVRWAKKEVPIFSGTEQRTTNVADNKLREMYRDAGRDGYARAWMNRRNARYRSGTVTLPGTPEIRVCNTIAFVGNFQNIMKKVASSQIAAAIGGIIGNSAVAIPSAGKITPGAAKALKEVLVYYVSSVTNNYVQGGQHTTTLTLTHGRHWTDPLPNGSVGYGLGRDATDEIELSMRKAHGQDGIDADAFAQAVSNRLQYAATGDQRYLKSLADDDSIFGMGARKVVAKKKKVARTSNPNETKGALERARSSVCKKLFGETDPNNVKQKVKDKKKTIGQGFNDLLASAKKQAAKALQDIKDALTDQADQLVSVYKKIAEEQLEKVEKFIDEAEEKAYDAIMGGKPFKILLEFEIGSSGVGSGTLPIPDALALPFKAIGGISDLLKLQIGLVLYVWIAKSTTDSDDAMDLAEQGLRGRTSDLLKPKCPGQILKLKMNTTETLVIVRPKGKGEIKKTYFIKGIAAFGVKPQC